MGSDDLKGDTSGDPDGKLGGVGHLQAIFRVINALPAASSAEEALAQIKDAFSSVDRELLQKGKIEKSYVVSSFSSLDSVNIGGKIVYYGLHGKDVLFLGENGAIDIQPGFNSTYETHEIMRRDPLLFKNRGKSIPPFPKAGADTLGVWDIPPTS
jgi:hypothetical protein